MQYSERSFSTSLKTGRVRIAQNLGHAVMVAQVDEQHAAVVADPVDPTRKTDGSRRCSRRSVRRRYGCDRRAFHRSPIGRSGRADTPARPPGSQAVTRRRWAAQRNGEDLRRKVPRGLRRWCCRSSNNGWPIRGTVQNSHSLKTMPRAVRWQGSRTGRPVAESGCRGRARGPRAGSGSEASCEGRADHRY